uniref:Uncharacterized protein n=1 Tax=Anguilla anguilla TaxID=7936 RepID=A0A0E9XLA2_ANGAN
MGSQHITFLQYAFKVTCEIFCSYCVIKKSPKSALGFQSPL